MSGSCVLARSFSQASCSLAISSCCWAMSAFCFAACPISGSGFGGFGLHIVNLQYFHQSIFDMAVAEHLEEPRRLVHPFYRNMNFPGAQLTHDTFNVGDKMARHPPFAALLATSKEYLPSQSPYAYACSCPDTLRSCLLTCLP